MIGECKITGKETPFMLRLKQQHNESLKKEQSAEPPRYETHVSGDYMHTASQIPVYVNPSPEAIAEADRILEL